MTAYSKAQKRAAKRGRPRLPATARQPNGQPSRREASVAEKERETKQPALEARSRVYGVPLADCSMDEAGYVLGRLYLRGDISRNQLAAGNRMAEAYSRYYGLTGIPVPSPRAQDLFRVSGLSGDADPEDARSAANRVMSIEHTLGMVDIEGRHVTTITKRVCVQDDDGGMAHPYTISLLVRGLDALVVHYGIGG